MRYWPFARYWPIGSQGSPIEGSIWAGYWWMSKKNLKLDDGSARWIPNICRFASWLSLGDPPITSSDRHFEATSRSLHLLLGASSGLYLLVEFVCRLLVATRGFSLEFFNCIILASVRLNSTRLEATRDSRLRFVGSLMSWLGMVLFIGSVVVSGAKDIISVPQGGNWIANFDDLRLLLSVTRLGLGVLRCVVLCGLLLGASALARSPESRLAKNRESPKRRRAEIRCRRSESEKLSRRAAIKRKPLLGNRLR